MKAHKPRACEPENGLRLVAIFFFPASDFFIRSFLEAENASPSFWAQKMRPSLSGRKKYVRFLSGRKKCVCSFVLGELIFQSTLVVQTALVSVQSAQVKVQSAQVKVRAAQVKVRAAQVKVLSALVPDQSMFVTDQSALVLSSLFK